MATKSILKTIHIKDRTTTISFVNALEHAKGKKEKTVKMSRACSEASRKEIALMFGEQNDGIQNR